MKKTALSAILALLLLVNLFITSCSNCEHEWVAPTCSKRRHCSICGEESGELLDHVSGEWTSVKESTLAEEGEEQRFCTACNKICDSRPVDKKEPQVYYTTFNFYDEEFIAWVNSTGLANIENTEVELEGGSTTNYMVELSDGNRAMMMLSHKNHSKYNYINGIIITSTDKNTAINLVAKIGRAIAPEFSLKYAPNALLKGDTYSSAGMVAMEFSVYDDL